ncbi:MAG: aminoacetone oxidase family FAD-binding enzyme [Lachnospiraceae bacterium]|nr:aminoacetone oxidase family FAD-binding enzyme [Lachnospiraceae bacterium]
MNEKNMDRVADIIVIGAGASGMMAAISAALFWKENHIKNKKIFLIDKNDRAGKKLLATGNGRCNLTNLKQGPGCYMTCGTESAAISGILSGFSPEDVIDFFKTNGMLTCDRGNYIYPKSMQAQTVADTLVRICESLNITVILNECISSIRYLASGFYRLLSGQGKEYTTKSLVLSTGSPASVKQDYNGYRLAETFGHSVISPLPALCGLKADFGGVAGTGDGKVFFKQTAGVRCEASAQAVVNGICVSKEQGELQITDYGLSGIVIFCLSRHISRGLFEKKPSAIWLDFLQDMPEPEIISYLYEENGRNLTLHQALSGLLNSKLAKGLITLLSGKYNGISIHTPVSRIKPVVLEALISKIKHFEVVISGTNEMERAQVCCGGVNLSELKADSLESRILPGLYLCGELLDVDGICGGYNLQWAWSSGHRAGVEAARRFCNEDTLKQKTERQDG